MKTGARLVKTGFKPVLSAPVCYLINLINSQGHIKVTEFRQSSKYKNTDPYRYKYIGLA